jgi:hypothetical protein
LDGGPDGAAGALNASTPGIPLSPGRPVESAVGTDFFNAETIGCELDRRTHFCERSGVSTGTVGGDGHGWLLWRDLSAGRSIGKGTRAAENMRRLTMSGLGVLVALSLATTGATGASAAPPTWSVCAKAANSGSGHYPAKTCLEEDKVEAGGKYELKEGLGKGKALKGKGGLAVLNAKTLTGTQAVECASSKSSGAPALPNRETGVAITFKKCKGPAGEACASAGLRPGEIQISALKGTLGYIQESPPIIGLTLESEAHPGPEGLLVGFSCAGLEATLKGSLGAIQRGDVNLISKASEMAFSGELQTEIDNKGEAMMLDTSPEPEGGGGGVGVLIGEDKAPGNGGDATSGEVTPVLFAAKAKGTIEELKFEKAFTPEGGWCSTLEVGVVEAKPEALSAFEFGGGGKKTTYGFTPGPLIESHSVACGTATPSILSIPGFHVPIEAGVHYFLTFLPLGPPGHHFDGSRISYGFVGTESVLFVGEYSGGKEVGSSAQKKNAIEEAPGLAKYEWWLEKKEAPIGIWAVGTKH